jgi:hypothetical protein
MSDTQDPSPLPPPADEPEPIASAGYRRPPRAGRFRLGQSGNPRGRPSRSSSKLGALVARTLAESIEAKENGKRRRMTKLEAAVKQLVNHAAEGDRQAAQFVFALIDDDAGRPPRRPARRAAEADALVVAELVRRLSGGRE